MLLNESGWRAYHEWACSPGLPWECQKQCILWRKFKEQVERAEGTPTYGTLERSTEEPPTIKERV